MGDLPVALRVSSSNGVAAERDGADELPGLNLETLARHLEANCPGLVTGKLSGRVIAGGSSNLTYLIGDAKSAWVLRRPPLGHVLATAHDMSREFRVMSALVSTDVP